MSRESLLRGSNAGLECISPAGTRRELGVVQPGVVAVGGQEAVVRALFNDASMIHDQN
jgi:hypothetical protein